MVAPPSMRVSATSRIAARSEDLRAEGRNGTPSRTVCSGTDTPANSSRSRAALGLAASGS